METKKCNVCNETKDISEFLKNRAKCKICYRKLQKEAIQSKIASTDNNQFNTCIKCNSQKRIADFALGRNTCRDCTNKAKRDKPKQIVSERKATDDNICCNTCNQTKNATLFLKGRNICKDCSNSKRRERYTNKKIEIENSTDTKKCLKCNILIPINQFANATNYCKSCYSSIRKDQIKEKEKDITNKTCKDCNTNQTIDNFREGEYVCYTCSKIKLYKWRKDNPEKTVEHSKVQRNKEGYREKQNEYKRNNYSNNITDKLGRDYRAALRNFIFKNTSSKKNKVFGCSRHMFLHWIESNMTPDMTIDNYGKYWNFDHIKPCSSFDLSIEDQLHECFNWKNTVPILVHDNSLKSNVPNTDIEKEYLTKSNKFSKKYNSKLKSKTAKLDLLNNNDAIIV